MHPLELQTLNIIHRDSLIPAGGKIVVGVSGGADSVGLLVVLSNLSEILNISLIAVYVDHGLRPDETEKERSYIDSLTAVLQVQFEGMKVNADEHAHAMKLSLEHAARDLRYQALRKVAGDYDASVITTAHTADDQAEEVIIRLLRGSGRKGISGMRTKYSDIARPFLETEKQDIIAYLGEKGIRFLEDSSNADLRFLRNRVRHELIPFLEQRFDTGIKQALRKTAESLAEDEKLLEELTERACEKIFITAGPDDEPPCRKLFIKRQEFVQQPEALQRRIIEKLLWQIGSRAHYTHIMQIIAAAKNGRTGSEIHLTKGLRVGVQREHLEFVYPEGRQAWRGRLYRE